MGHSVVDQFAGDQHHVPQDPSEAVDVAQLLAHRRGCGRSAGKRERHERLIPTKHLSYCFPRLCESHTPISTGSVAIAGIILVVISASTILRSEHPAGGAADGGAQLMCRALGMDGTPPGATVAD